MVLFFAFALGLHAGAAEAAPTIDERGLPAVRNFPPRVYGGTNQVWNGVAGRDGTLFFGNKGQVLEFDGLTWNQIPVPGGAFIRCLAVDGDDVVWVGGVNELGRIVRAPGGRRVYESLRAHVPADITDLRDFWRVYATPQGIWFQSNEVVLRWRDGKFETWRMSERFITLGHWLGDHLLVAREKGWFRPIANGAWEQVGAPADRLGDYLPSFVLPHPSGQGWLMSLQGPKGELAGFARWDGAKLEFEPHPLDAFFKMKRLLHGTRVRDGRYLFGTLQGGVVVLGPTLQFETWLSEASGLPSDAAISFLEDAHGAVWIGTEYGVSRVLIHPSYSWFTSINGLGRGAGHPTLRWDGQLLFGGLNGIQRYTAPTAVPSLPKLEPWSAVAEKIATFAVVNDGFMVGGLGGVWHVNPEGKATRLPRSGSNTVSILQSRLFPNRIYSIGLNGLCIFGRKDDMWVAEALYREARGASMFEAEDGTLWIGTDTPGVIRVRFSVPYTNTVPEIMRFGPSFGLPLEAGQVRIQRVGGAPLFLSDRGLFRFNERTGKFDPDASYGTQFADGSTRVDSVAEDSRGGIWMIVRPNGGALPSGVKQLGYILNGQWEQLPLPDLERIDGMSTLRLETVAGRDLLWLNGQAGVLRIDLTTRRTVGDPVIGATILHEATTSDGRPFAADTSKLASDRRLRIAARENSVRFRFGTPGFAGEPDVRHESRLVGFADGGAEVGAAGERTFTNLPAGNYVFEVRGRSADGRWSQPATLAFEVLAPWWATRWAWTGYACFLGAGIYGIVRRRTHALERERRRLEAVVGARTAELADKNRELERLNRMEQDEKLAARLAEEKARLELLRYQLNPHFLFNSLNSIRALVYANPDAAGEMVTRLAEFCRWTLARGSDETTTVADEAEMVRTYLDIEKVRWQDALVTQVEIDEAARGERLPQFLLLPLIENAIKYGGRTSPGTLEVRVSVRLDGEMLECEVANTGQWIEPSARPTATSTHIGLENLRQRLARHYGSKWSLDVVRESGWVRLRVRLQRGLAAEPRRPTSQDPFVAS